MSLKPIVRLFVLFACLLACAVPSAHAAAPAKPKNLLGNPGFERNFPAHDWMPAVWDTSDAGLSTVFFGRDSIFAHEGRYSVNIANTSTVYPMAHNWSQTLLVSKDWWNKTARFTVWSKSNGLQGRAYVMIQAYRDTASKMARIWGVDRDEARRRLNIKRVDDPLIDLGWKRQAFTESQTDWVKREVSTYIPAGTNVVFLRCGLFGTGQVYFDDANLVLGPPTPPGPVTGNLFQDPGFENGGLAWEWVAPPFEGGIVELDSTTAHSGRYSMRVDHMNDGLTSTRSGVTQPIPGRALAGKRLRLTGWFKADSLQGSAYLEMFAHTAAGPHRSPLYEMLSNTFDWTQLSMEWNVPPGTVTVWPWLHVPAPFRGTVWLDDASLEVVGPATNDGPILVPKPATKRAGR
ncbi:MAG: hypothetical protein U0704_15055 [Candidatus Eisenbacteria bacterium]